MIRLTVVCDGCCTAQIGMPLPADRVARTARKEAETLEMFP